MKKNFTTILLGLLVAAVMSSCVNSNKFNNNSNSESTAGLLYVINSGNPSFEDASLSIYDPKRKQVQNEAFAEANNADLGDMACSMTMYSSLGWIVVGGSDLIYAVDPASARKKGVITGFASPRQIHFVNSTKAYVTQQGDPRICVVDPGNYRIKDYISSTAYSTEQMVQVGSYVYVTCWQNQQKVLQIDTATDKVVGELEVGLQPRWMVVDKNSKLWVLTDGGDKDGKNEEYPRLVKIDPKTFSIEQTFWMNDYEEPHSLSLNRYKDTLLWITGEGIWKMSVNDTQLPVLQHIENHRNSYTAMLVDYTSDEIYVADSPNGAINHTIYRYTFDGNKVDQFNVGRNPSALCFER